MEFDYTFISALVRELTGKVNAFSPSTLDVQFYNAHSNCEGKNVAVFYNILSGDH